MYNDLMTSENETFRTRSCMLVANKLSMWRDGPLYFIISGLNVLFL